MKNLTWKSWFAILIGISFFQAALADSGICYQEMRYLSEEELVHNVLNQKPIVELEACRIAGTPYELRNLAGFINLLLGRKIYQVDCAEQTESGEYRLSYRWTNSCGTQNLSPDSGTGEDISKEYYESIMKKNKAYWSK